MPFDKAIDFVLDHLKVDEHEKVTWKPKVQRDTLTLNVLMTGIKSSCLWAYP